MSQDAQPLSAERLAALSQRFSEHGTTIYGAASPNGSPLYAHLSQCVAADPEVLALLADADASTTITNLLFGAVHYLLLGGRHHHLSGFYPDLSAQPLSRSDVYPAFRAFCLDHQREIIHLVTTRRVQTNEVRRCAILLPAFQLVWRWCGGRPLALVEVGTSAGLHLLWDHYGYDYGRAGAVGDLSSPVRITCEPRGACLPPILTVLPEVSYRIGIDIAPINVHDEEATRWLRALIWPEHSDRRHLLDATLGVAQRHSPRLIQGDAADVPPAVLACVPADAVLCVFDSYTLNQVPRGLRERILARLAEHAEVRDVFRITQEGFSLQEPPHLEVSTFRKGTVHSTVLAHCESHGRWITWSDQG